MYTDEYSAKLATDEMRVIPALKYIIIRAEARHRRNVYAQALTFP